VREGREYSYKSKNLLTEVGPFVSGKKCLIRIAMKECVRGSESYANVLNTYTKGNATLKHCMTF